jgi:hypothetical protein
MTLQVVDAALWEPRLYNEECAETAGSKNFFRYAVRDRIR